MAIATIDISHRVTLIGSTGDGKTTLGLKILRRVVEAKQLPIVILNPWAEESLYELFGEGRPDIDTTFPAVQHVTPPATLDYKNYGRIFGQILLHGNVGVFIDEVAGVGDAHNFSVMLKTMYQGGRRRNVFTVGVTQRPLDIPAFILKMSEHIFIGDVMGQDLKKVEEHTQQRFADAIQSRQQYEFLYWSRLLKEPPKAVRMD